MSTTTFKSVGGTSKPAKKAADQPATPKVTPKAAAKKPAAPKRKPGIIIKGEGTIRVFDNGAMRRLPRGERIEVSAEELAYLKRRQIDFS